MYLWYDVRIQTYIATHTACIQHVNVGLAQVCPNYSEWADPRHHMGSYVYGMHTLILWGAICVKIMFFLLFI